MKKLLFIFLFAFSCSKHDARVRDHSAATYEASLLLGGEASCSGTAESPEERAGGGGCHAFNADDPVSGGYVCRSNRYGEDPSARGIVACPPDLSQKCVIIPASRKPA